MSNPSSNPATSKPAEAEAEEKTAGKAPPPAWQAADYNGPLTGDQAEWRAHHIKPVKQARTK